MNLLVMRLTKKFSVLIPRAVRIQIILYSTQIQFSWQNLQTQI